MNPLSAVPWHALSNGCMAEVGCNAFVQFLCRSSCVCVCTQVCPGTCLYVCSLVHEEILVCASAYVCPPT